MRSEREVAKGLGSKVTSRFLREIERFQPLPVDLGQAVWEGLKETVGETTAQAIIYHLGDGALKDPATLAARMERLFGFGAKIVLGYILDYVKRSRKSSKSRQAKMASL